MMCNSITIVQNNNRYDIRFKYDKVAIEYIKSVPGRMWHPESKIWSIPKDKLGFLINQLKGTPYESIVRINSNENISVNSTLDSTFEIPDVDISNVNYHVKEGCNPYSHQLDLMKFALNRQQNGNLSGFLICDEQGLGKTSESFNLAIHNKETLNFKHCLIICCINSSKYNWFHEIEENTKGVYHPYILGSRIRRNGSIKQDGSSKQKYEDLVSGKMYNDLDGDDLPYFIIMNIEAIRYKEGKKFIIADEITRYINSGELNMVIIDEVHKNVSPTSQQGKQLLKIKKNTCSKAMWIPMTGTPITNKPTDVFLPLKLTDSHNWSSYYTWCLEFCIYGGYGDHEIIGYKNIPKLKTMLQGNMIRRLKKDVLDLPDKIYYTEYVENTPYQTKLYSNTCSSIRNDREVILQSLNPLSQLLKLRQVNGSPELVDDNLIVDIQYLNKNAKLKRLLELLEEIHQSHQKVIIFSNWVSPLRTLFRFVSKKYNVCSFTGTMSSEDREINKRRFQEDPKYTVMLGTIGAAGTTHTFTAANNVIFYDEPWTPSDKQQAEDRAHRIGTKTSVNVYTLITKDTVDEKVHDILYTKSGMSNYIVDNKLDLRKDPKLFDLLLSDTKH